MPTFQYIAISNEGKQIKGKIDSPDERQAFQTLKDSGVSVLRIKLLTPSVFVREIAFLEPKVKAENFVVFCRQFATLIKAGIAVADALHVLMQQTEDKTLKKTLNHVHGDVRAGLQLSFAFSKFPKVFSNLFVNMVRAGEASGNLDEVLEKLATFIEKEHVTAGKIKSALTYPVTVLIIAFLATFFLMWKVVPQFVNTFVGLGIELPLTTRIVMKVSDLVVQFWYIVMLLPFLLFTGVKAWGRTERGRYIIDYTKLKTPVFGKLLQKSAMARFSRTFSSLFAAGVPILQILDIVAKVVENKVLVNTLEKSKENVRRGQSLAANLKTNWAFPPLVTHMVMIGEQTGALDSVLDKIADFYENDVDQMSDRLKSLLEPFMIIVLTVIVGVIVLAILQPSFSLYGNMNG